MSATSGARMSPGSSMRRIGVVKACGMRLVVGTRDPGVGITDFNTSVVTRGAGCALSRRYPSISASASGARRRPRQAAATGWRYDLSDTTRPKLQYCYYTQALDKGLSAKYTLAVTVLRADHLPWQSFHS